MSHVTAASFPKSTLLKHPLNEDLLCFMHSPPSAGTRPPPPRLPPPPPHSSPPSRMPSPPPEVATATSGALARRRCPSLLVDTASRWQHEAPPPARRPQRSPSAAPNARPPRRAGPPATGRWSREQALHRRRCGRRAAPWQWGSNSAPPPSLGRAPIPPEPSISKSGPRDLEFEYPVVVFKVERARYKIDTRGESSTTKRSFRHGFEFCAGWCRPSCSTWES